MVQITGSCPIKKLEDDQTPIGLRFKKSRRDHSRSIFVQFPPRIASFCASLRNDALRIVSTLVGQLNGSSVPNTTWPAPTSATRCRKPSSETTIESTRIWLFKYSLGCFLFTQLALFRTWQATSKRPRYDGMYPPPCAAQIFNPGKRSRVPLNIM